MTEIPLWLEIAGLIAAIALGVLVILGGAAFAHQIAAWHQQKKKER
jgi:hypothetical protein